MHCGETMDHSIDGSNSIVLLIFDLACASFSASISMYLLSPLKVVISRQKKIAGFLLTTKGINFAPETNSLIPVICGPATTKWCSNPSNLLNLEVYHWNWMYVFVVYWNLLQTVTLTCYCYCYCLCSFWCIPCGFGISLSLSKEDVCVSCINGIIEQLELESYISVCNFHRSPDVTYISETERAFGLS